MTDRQMLEQVVTDRLPPTVSKKTVMVTVRGLNKMYKTLKREFWDAVREEARRLTAPDKKRLCELRKELQVEEQRIVNMKIGVAAFLSKEEFLLVRSCLHPDKNNHPKTGEAFKTFNRLADVRNWRD